MAMCRYMFKTLLALQNSTRLAFQGEEYTLFWPERSEFVRMAARFGATIIPFGTVGEDDIGQVSLKLFVMTSCFHVDY